MHARAVRSERHPVRAIVLSCATALRTDLDKQQGHGVFGARVVACSAMNRLRHVLEHKVKVYLILVAAIPRRCLPRPRLAHEHAPRAPAVAAFFSIKKM